MWNQTGAQSIGRCKIKSVNPANNLKYKVDYVIVEEDLTPLISKTAAERRMMITFNYESIERVNVVKTTNFVKEYSNVFSTTQIGVLPGTNVHLTVNKDI